MRSGQQSALAQDLKGLIDALHLQQPILVGYDWGARAACATAALWPEKVSFDNPDIVDIVTIRIDIGTGRLSVIQIWKRLKGSFPLGQRSVYRQLFVPKGANLGICGDHGKRNLLNLRPPPDP